MDGSIGQGVAYAQTPSARSAPPENSALVSLAETSKRQASRILSITERLSNLADNTFGFTPTPNNGQGNTPVQGNKPPKIVDAMVSAQQIDAALDQLIIQIDRFQTL